MFDDVYQRAAAEGSTLVDKIQRILHAALEIHARDDSFAMFANTVHVDIERNAEVKEALDQVGYLKQTEFFTTLVAEARRRGEVESTMSDESVAEVIGAIITGLAHLAGRAGILELAEAHRATYELLAGQLFLERSVAHATNVASSG